MTESEEHYVQYVNLIRKVVWDFIKKMGLRKTEFDEQFSRANLYYVLATTTYDGNIAKFSTWLYIQIWNRLLNDHNKKRWEWERLNRLRERYTDKNTCSHAQPPIWWLEDELNEDAKFLVLLICTGRLDDLLFNKNGTFIRRTLIIKNVYRFLKHYGWKRVRIRKCFKNIKQALEE